MLETTTPGIEIRRQDGAPRTKGARKRREADGLDRSPDDTRPVIRVIPGEMSRAVDEAEFALIAAGRPIFSRAGRLVRPVVEEVGASDERTTMAARLSEVGVDAMAGALAQVARFEQWSERKGRYVDIDPPEKVARTLLSREGDWKLSRVTGVITTPTLRRDGSLLSTPGHDQRTGLYLAADASYRMPTIPEAPTRAQARASARMLEDLLTNFPFVGPVDRSVALSGILTAVVRGTMPAAPLHAIRASTPGSGKSYLADVISAVATGRICPAIAPGKTEEEMEKRLGARLLHAVPLMTIDNVIGELGGVFLCQVTERPIVSIRILGKSEMRDVECRTLVLATGNNLTLVGDMTRRTVLCTLDAEVERPETRQFDFAPVERVLRDRGAYIAAALTVIRAYRAAGFPDPLPSLASYGEWSLTVRSALTWLGYADPARSMETAREEDPELSAIRELFGHWERRLGLNSGYTSVEVVNSANALAPTGPGDDSGFADPEFRDLLLRQAGDRGQINTRRLGKWFSKIGGRPVEGLRMTVATNDSHGNRYSLQKAPDRNRFAELRPVETEPRYQPSA